MWFFAICWAAAAADPFDAKFPAEAIRRVVLDVKMGNVVFVADAEGHVWFRGTPESWPDSCVVSSVAEADTARLTVTGGSPMAPCVASWEVHVAPEMALEVVLSGGNLTLPAMTGAVRVDIGAGDVRLADVGGPLTLQLNAGVVEGTFVGPNLDANIGSGGLHLTNLVAPVRTVLSVGDISLDFLVAPAGDVAVRTGVGSVRVLLPKDSPVDVAVGGGLGKKRIEVPNTPGARTRVRVETKVGSCSVAYKP